MDLGWAEKMSEAEQHHQARDPENHPNFHKTKSQVVKGHTQVLKERFKSLYATNDTRGFDNTAVGVSAFYRHVCQEMKNESDFLSIFATVILTFCFTVAVLGTLGQVDAFSVQEAVTNDIEEDANFAGIHKIFRDAHSVADFWSWLRVGAVPLILQSTSPYTAFSEQYPFDGNLNASTGSGGERHYLRYNYLISGVRLAQVLGEASDCRIDLPAWEGRQCYPGGRFDLPPKFGHLALNVDAEERIEWFFLSKTPQEHAEHMIDMEDGCALLETKGRECLLDSE